MTANLDQLELVALIRMYNNGTLTWTTKEGNTIPVNSMSDEHLVNTINMLRRNKLRQEIIDEYNQNAYDNIGCID